MSSVRFLRGKDGSERVVLSLAELQALLDAASVAEHGLPDIAAVVDELRAVLSSESEYVDAAEFLEQYDAAHVAR